MLDCDAVIESYTWYPYSDFFLPTFLKWLPGIQAQRTPKQTYTSYDLESDHIAVHPSITFFV